MEASPVEPELIAEQHGFPRRETKPHRSDSAGSATKQSSN
jgi:hypothetical protein